jgi:rhomboid-like protein
MSFMKAHQPLMRSCTSALRQLSTPRNRLLPYGTILQYQTRVRHYSPPRRSSNSTPATKLKPKTYFQDPEPQNLQGQQSVPEKEPQNDEQPESNAEDQQGKGEQYVFVRIRYLRPAIWAVSASAGIYTFLAFLQAKEEAKPPPAPQLRIPPQLSRGGNIPPNPKEVATQYWNTLNPISKLSIGIIATNGAVHLSSFLVPGYWGQLWHTPALNRNFTHFTSMFVHSGPFHFLVNMWACWNFLLPVGYSPLFEGNPYHTLSFFLSTGVLSGYAQHLSTLLARSPNALITPSGGASGALFGVFAAFCMQYPDAGVGIIFVPITIAASTMLPVVMGFDLVGAIRGYRGLNLGHAVSTPSRTLGCR